MEGSGEIRHEFVNGNLIAMSGSSGKHHFICQNPFLALLYSTKPLGFNVYIEKMKVKIQNEDQYYYPDIFITKEPGIDKNKNVQFEPELIVEVLSGNTGAKDMVDNLIPCRKIDDKG